MIDGWKLEIIRVRLVPQGSGTDSGGYGGHAICVWGFNIVGCHVA